MYSIEKYTANALSLTNSFVIKLRAVAIKTNILLLEKYGIAPSNNKAEWKYYLNMSGELHSTNNEVMIKLIETGTYVPLTKEVLKTYSITRNTLREFGSYYIDLVEKYPDDFDYIKGCMYPVPIQTAIDAPDGTILSYDKDLVASNEVSLIRELETDIKGLINRYLIPDYIPVDELYLTSFIGLLYSVLPGWIISKRLEKIHTSEVDSFHLEHFFRSKLDIWDLVKHLNPKSIMWLYRNLDYLLINNCNKESFELMIENVFAANSIGVSSLELQSVPPELLTGTSSTDTAAYITRDCVFKVKDLSSISNYTNKSTYTLPELVDEQSRLTNGNTAIVKETLVREALKTINKSNIIAQPTKTLLLPTPNTYDISPVDRLNIILDNWLVLTHTDSVYVGNTVFKDPNNSVEIELTPKAGLYLLYFFIFKSIGIETPTLTELRYSNVLNTTITKTELMENLYSGYLVDEYVDELLQKIPSTPPLITDSVSLGNYLDKIIDVYRYVWVTDSNSSNPLVSANIKRISSRIRKTGVVPISDTLTLEEILLREGVDIDTSGIYDYTASVDKLFKQFTNTNFNPEEDMLNTLDIMKQLLDRLTSYTTQVITGFANSVTLKVPHTTPSVLQTEQALIEVTEAYTCKPVEDPVGVTVGWGNDFDDQISTNHIHHGVSGRIGVAPMLTTSVNMGEYEVFAQPLVYGEIIRSPHTPYSPSIIGRSNDYSDSITHINRTVYIDGAIANDVMVTTSYKSDIEQQYQPTVYGEILSDISNPYLPGIHGASNNYKEAIKINIPVNYPTGKVADDIMVTTSYSVGIEQQYQPVTYGEVLSDITNPYSPGISGGGNIQDNNIGVTTTSLTPRTKEYETRPVTRATTGTPEVRVINVAPEVYVEIDDK